MKTLVQFIKESQSNGFVEAVTEILSVLGINDTEAQNELENFVSGSKKSFYTLYTNKLVDNSKFDKLNKIANKCKEIDAFEKDDVSDIYQSVCANTGNKKLNKVFDEDNLVIYAEKNRADYLLFDKKGVQLAIH